MDSSLSHCFRLKEGQQVTGGRATIRIRLSKLHAHGQKVPTDVDRELPRRVRRSFLHVARVTSVPPRPSGIRFTTPTTEPAQNLAAGQYSGQVGPVYIEPRHEPGRYDREVFLVLKEFEPTFSRGGDMTQDFLFPTSRVTVNLTIGLLIKDRSVHKPCRTSSQRSRCSPTIRTS